VGAECIYELCIDNRSISGVESTCTSSIVSPGTRDGRRRSLIRGLVETVGETSTERIRLANYRHQHSSSQTITREISRSEDKDKEVNIPNPPKSGRKGIYNQLPSITHQ
jgi:hypothetical protein